MLNGVFRIFSLNSKLLKTLRSISLALLDYGLTIIIQFKHENKKKTAFDNVFIQVDVGKQTAPVRGRMEGVILDLFEMFFCFTLFLFCLFEVSDL